MLWAVLVSGAAAVCASKDDDKFWTVILILALLASIALGFGVGLMGCGCCPSCICCLLCKPVQDVLQRGELPGKQEGYSNIA
jgi:hypothetical protein